MLSKRDKGVIGPWEVVAIALVLALVGFVVWRMTTTDGETTDTMESEDITEEATTDEEDAIVTDEPAMNDEIYGIIGQPHGEVANGNLTFQVEAYGDVDRAVFRIVDAGHIDTTINTYTQYTYRDYTDADGVTMRYFSYDWDSTGVDDGDYRLYAYVQNEDGSGLVNHQDGKEYLEFSVENPTEVPENNPTTE